MINYDQYYKKGGTYVIPVEIFNDLLGEVEELYNKIDKAIEIIEGCNLGKFDYSIDQLGIIKLLEILKGDVD